MIFFKKNKIFFLLFFLLSCATPADIVVKKSKKHKKKSANNSKVVDPNEGKNESKLEEIKYNYSKELNYSLRSLPFILAELRHEDIPIISIQDAENEKSFETLMNSLKAAMLNNKNFEDILALGRKIQKYALKNKLKNLDDINFELAHAALKEKKYSLFDFFIDEASSSMDPYVKAACLNLQAIVAIDENRIPEAVQYWKNALAIKKDYYPARVNLALRLLESGQFEESQKILDKIPEDALTAIAQIVTTRHLGNNNKSQKLCGDLLLKNAQYKPLIYNCGLFEWQNVNNVEKAKLLFKQSIQLKGGSAIREERTYKFLDIL